MLRKFEKELKTLMRRLVNRFELEYGLLVDSLGPKAFGLRTRPRYTTQKSSDPIQLKSAQP